MADPHTDADEVDLDQPPPRVFGADLAASHGDRERWARFYAARFPDCTVTNGEQIAWVQGIGADVILQRPSGKQLLIEEKLRAPAYRDCLIEVWSRYYRDDDPRNRVGWSLDPEKQPHLLAYVVRPLSRCWLLPFDPYRDLSRRVVADPVAYGAAGEFRRSRTVGKNGAVWTTIHTSIPWAVVYQALHLAPADVCFEW